MSLQDPLTLSIKGMVCGRCISVLRSEFEKMGLKVDDIRLGSVTLSGTSPLKSRAPLQQIIEKNGFALLEDKKQELLHQIRTEVVRYYQDEIALHQDKKLAVYLHEQLEQPYDSLSTLFSSLTGTTLEHFAVEKRLERVKELLVYSEMSLVEMAVRTGFSSVHYLSNHFKAMTGLPPSHFRQLRTKKR